MQPVADQGADQGIDHGMHTFMRDHTSCFAAVFLHMTEQDNLPMHCSNRALLSLFVI